MRRETGPKINPELANRDVDLVINTAFDLYNLPRAGWVKRGVEEKKIESVGQHTEALTSLFNSVIEQIDPEKKLDRKKMLRLIQIHDWPEILAGDQVPYDDDPLIERKLEEKKVNDEQRAMELICARFGDKGTELMVLWLEYEANETPEAQIINQLDKIQALQKAFEYELAGEPVSAQEFVDLEKRKDRIKHPVLKEMMLDIERKINSKKKFTTTEEVLKHFGIKPEENVLPMPDSKSPERIWEDYFNEFSRFLRLFGKKNRKLLLLELENSAKNYGGGKVLLNLEDYCGYYRKDLSAEDVQKTRQSKLGFFKLIDRIIKEVNADYESGNLDLDDFEQKINILLAYKII